MFGIMQKTKYETEDGRIFDNETDAAVHGLARMLFGDTPIGTFESPERAEATARYILANFDIEPKGD